MLFHRELRPGDERVRMTVPEEETTTPVNLFKIGLFAAFGFLVMAGLSQPETRGAPLFVGALIIALLALTGAFLMWQRRYGESTLKATTSFEYGRRFEGWIETELTRVPPAAVSVKLEGRRGKHVWIAEYDRVEPARLQKDERGTLRVPFSIQVPADERGAMAIRIIVRTRTWPVGWGATFLL